MFVPFRWMPTFFLTTAFCTVIVSQATAQGAVDRIRTERGGSQAGVVEEMSPTEVVLSKGSSNSQTIPVNEIVSILFKGEPSELTQARVNANNEGYLNALELLEKIDVSSVDRDFIQQDIQFYKAWCKAKLAIGGSGSILEAGREVKKFLTSHPKNYHYFTAVEVFGDLLVANGMHDRAETPYKELAKAPWPDYQMRAQVLLGGALQRQGKHDEAIRQFDAVLKKTQDATGDKDAVRGQKLAATLGKAISLAETSDIQKGVEMIETVIQDADPEQKALHARAYNALGNCYERAGKKKDALLAFLHVDLLYSTLPEAHAEALAHLVPLWESIGQEERAREAKQRLRQRYATSPWAREQ